MTLILPDSGGAEAPDGRRHAPSAARNEAPILDVLRREAPVRGQMLELASGTGQHAAAFATTLPGLDWQPTDADAAHLPSINAWRAHVAAPNLRAPVLLDAGVAGWGDTQCDALLAVNLLHLIAQDATATLLAETARALRPGGVAFFYGPFLRDGQTTSDGDAAFDASLRAQDARLGYKDMGHILTALALAGLRVRHQQMPANNLMLIARRMA